MNCQTNPFFFQYSSLEITNDDDLLTRSLQPTPINPNRMIAVVERVPLNATLWNFDRFSYKSLQDLRFNLQRTEEPPSLVTSSNVSVISMSSGDEAMESNCYRQSQVDLWNQRYEELVEFQREHNHCNVPLKNYKNPSLSHWVKRQRYQYRVKQEGKHSTLNDERQASLEKLGFVWDSHAASWEERWNDLCVFHEIHGHSNVPKTYKANQQLAVWVKGQRRQFKLHTQGKSSAMSMDRIEKLLYLGFVFDPRSQR